MNPVSVLDATQLYTLKVVEVVTFMLFVSYHTHTHTQAGFGRTLLVCVTETRFRWSVR